ncbi:MAG: GNAT family N-acetyltransferase [Firmicutes bacterium]|nr:GNAT family N-acetyltransferase [Bacillota bacterium]
MIRKALPEEFQEVRLFYHAVIDGLEGREHHPKWQKDVYPSPEDLMTEIEEGNLYLYLCDGQIAGSMVLNKKHSREYDDVSWPEKLQSGEFFVIHMLGIRSDFEGRGLAREMVRFAIHLAKESGLKAVRLDVIEGNLPAERLYESMGFKHIDTISIFYEVVGSMNFSIYEYRL